MNYKSVPAHSPSQLARKLWDGILKSMIQHMPEQFFPLFKHVFGKDYPQNTQIELLSTEYSAPGKSNPGNLSSIFADVVLRIAGSDIYHLEGQIADEAHLPFRMFEYDTHIALLYGVSDYNLRFPASIILYLDHNHTVPRHNTCQIVLSDNSKAIYTVSVVNIQAYSLQQIQENHLTLFLPFTLLRFRPRLNSSKNPVTKEELTIFVNEIIIILKDELGENYITPRQYKDYINYLRSAADQILIDHLELHTEVIDMLTEIIPSYSELEDQITERVTAEVTTKVTNEVTAKVTNEVTNEVTALFTMKLQKKSLSSLRPIRKMLNYARF